MQHHMSVLVPLLVCAALLLAACGGSPSSGPTSAAASTSANSAGSSGSDRSQPQNRTDNQPGGNTAASTAAAPEASAAAQSQPEAAAASAAPAAGGAPPAAAGAPAGAAGQSTNAPPANQPPRRSTTRRPPANDTPYDSTFYQNYGVNPFVETWEDQLSTFAMDIDTASYGVMRRYLNDGNLPDPNSVRVEEYLNNFNYRYPQPDAGSTFAIYTEAAPSPFSARGYEMVQIGIQGRAIADENRAPTSLTFVIDVSGSMNREDRLETVKQALTMLVEQLRPDDKIGIVIYGTDARSILSPTSGANKQRILDALNELTPSGSTNVEAGLDIGFAQADEAFVRGSNMILLLSDGVANNGVTDPQALLAKYKQYTSKGIKLSTYGFGMGNYNFYPRQPANDPC